MKNDPMKFKTQGVWKRFEEFPNSRPICLQMVIATKTKTKDSLAGVVGGYCGSDLFVMEQFFAKIKNDKLTNLWIGSEDAITGQEVDFCELGDAVLKTCHQALEECWEWNSENNWLEAQQLRLYPYCLEGLKSQNGLLKTATSDPVLNKILKLAETHLALVSPKLYMSKNDTSNINKKAHAQNIKDELTL